MTFLWPTFSTAFKCRIYRWSEKTEGITTHQPNKQIYVRPVQISMQYSFFAYQRKNWCATSNFNKYRITCLTCVAENGLIQAVFLLCSLLCFTKGITPLILVHIKKAEEWIGQNIISSTKRKDLIIKTALVVDCILNEVVKIALLTDNTPL